MALYKISHFSISYQSVALVVMIERSLKKFRALKTNLGEPFSPPELSHAGRCPRTVLIIRLVDEVKALFDGVSADG